MDQSKEASRTKFSLKEKLVMRAIHVQLSLNQPKRTYVIPLPVQKELLEGFLV